MRIGSQGRKGLAFAAAAACLLWPKAAIAQVVAAPVRIYTQMGVAPNAVSAQQRVGPLTVSAQSRAVPVHTVIFLASQVGDRIAIVGALTSPRPRAVEVAMVGGADRGIVWRRYPIADTGKRPLGWQVSVPAPALDGSAVTLLARVVDAGRVDPDPAATTVNVDTLPPRIRGLQIDGGRPESNSNKVLLHSDVQGASLMRIARDPRELEFAPWLPYKPNAVATVVMQEGEQHLVVQYADAAGNRTAPADGELGIVIDTTPPELVDAATADGGIALTFDEAVLPGPAEGLTLDGGKSGADLRATASDRTLLLPVAHLAPGSWHTLAIGAANRITDLAGNRAAKASRTLFVPDVVPPTPPRAVSVTSSASIVMLAWGPATDDVRVTQYRVYRGDRTLPARPSSDAFVGSTSGREFVDDTAISGGDYYYGIAAVDEAGNVSTLSREMRVTVAVAPRYHGQESGNTNQCKDCHSSNSTSLLDPKQQRTRCYSCHDGTGSRFNAQADFGESAGATLSPTSSSHPVVSGRLRCVDCHSPHRSATHDPRLLTVAAADGEFVRGGTRFCLVCHEELKPPDPRAAVGRVADAGFARSSHASLPVADGTGIACSACHNGHASAYPILLAQPETALCFSCHGTGARGPLGWDVVAQFSGASHHSVEGSATDGLLGGNLRCSSCHGAHLARRGASGLSDLAARVIDPAQPSHPWDPSAGTMTDFCLRCHRSASSGQGVPLAQVTFPIVDPVRYPFFTGWDKTGFGDSAHSETDAAAAPRGGCALCHQPHGSDNPSTLLRPEDTTASAGMCLTCHGGSGGAPDIGVALAKASHHPVLERTGIHKDLEGPTELGYNGGTPDMRHAECQDCHDSHLAGPGRRQPGSPLAGPALNGIGGVTAERWPDSPMGSPLVGDYRAIKIQAGLSEEWQVCFKCHSRYTSLPETDSAGRPTRDIAAEFNPHNASFHPVVVPSRGTTVNGFVEGGPWQPGSRMACTDCHSNDDTSPAAAVGPHGSANPGILRRPFDAKTGTPGTDGDLCFLCHDRGVYGGGDDPGADATRSAFSDGQRDLHDIGLPGQGHRVACVACHSTIVHGGTRPALLVSVDDTAPYRSDGAPGVTLTAGMPSPGGWTPDSCSHEGACHR